MHVETIALFALTEVLLSLTPGPAVLLVVGLSLRQGLPAGLAATAGVLATNAVYFSLSALGVGALILASATLFTVLKWMGAAYLVWLGVAMMRPLLRHWREGEAGGAAVDLEAAHRAAPAGGLRKAVWRGFALQGSNPKNLAFFVAILPQFVSADAALGMQMVVLGVVSVLLEAPILIAYALAASLSARLMRQRLVTLLEAIGGGVLVGLGAALAASSRSD
ncbi:LysE family translocator [Acuticoccus mangrovi]|uniref:LysE family translocator n=1 Tax=Acuticoccus mangrovi TaxID=2796142 RepID=A0A934IJY3_9HYPH|nr:LysE family translocator [Acuticoccus mangrovi]MBJ3776371.1 LysE family translocator [Acuticoccus mangrovi]